METELILAIEHDLCLFVKEALSIGQPFEADGLDAAVAKNNAASWLIVGEAIAREKDLTDSAFLPRHFDAALESGPIEIVAVAFLRGYRPTPAQVDSCRSRGFAGIDVAYAAVSSAGLTLT